MAVRRHRSTVEAVSPTLPTPRNVGRVRAAQPRALLIGRRTRHRSRSRERAGTRNWPISLVSRRGLFTSAPRPPVSRETMGVRPFGALRGHHLGGDVGLRRRGLVVSLGQLLLGPQGRVSPRSRPADACCSGTQTCTKSPGSSSNLLSRPMMNTMPTLNRSVGRRLSRVGAILVHHGRLVTRRILTRPAHEPIVKR
jgi:hypothetical protein